MSEKKKKASKLGKLAGVPHAPSVKGRPKREPSKAELRAQLTEAVERTERERKGRSGKRSDKDD